MDVTNQALNLIFDSSDEEMETIPRPRFVRERLEHFVEMDDIDFVRRFRLSKQSCLNLLDLIDSKLEFPTDKNYAVSPVNQVLLCLRFYATGCTQISAADFSGVSESTAHRIVHRVTAAIASLYKHFIYFPRNANEIRKTQTEFYMIARFPKVVGAIDCTHVKIRSPGGHNAEYFRNRKGYFSLNVQAICNANLEFLDIVARWPGSTHDQTIFDNSRQRSLFEDKKYGDSILLGDSAYACRSYLLTPLLSPSTPAESLYNESQIRTRNPIERAFGVWKRRFPVLALGLAVHIDKAMPIIVATGVLFNILRRSGEAEPPNDPMTVLPMPWNSLIEMGQIENTQQRQSNRIATQQIFIRDYFGSLQGAYS